MHLKAFLAAAVLVAGACGRDTTRTFMDATKKSHASLHWKLKSRGLQSQQDLESFKDLVLDQYDQYLASCYGSYGLDQAIRCAVELAFDTTAAAFGSDPYGPLEDLDRELNISFTALSQFADGGTLDASACSSIFASDVASCVGLYVASGSDVVAFISELEQEELTRDGCGTLNDLYAFDGDEAYEEASMEVSEPVFTEFEDLFSRRRLQDIFAEEESFETSESEQGGVTSDSVADAVDEFHAVALQCQNIDGSIFADVPDIAPPSSAGIEMASVFVATLLFICVVF